MVEADPKNFAELLKKNRKSYAIFVSALAILATLLGVLMEYSKAD